MFRSRRKDTGSLWEVVRLFLGVGVEGLRRPRKCGSWKVCAGDLEEKLRASFGRLVTVTSMQRKKRRGNLPLVLCGALPPGR